MKKIGFLILFLGFILVFSSCSKQEDCSLKDTKYIKYTFNEDSGNCEILTEIKKNVCGNGIIEQGEDFCSCPKDVSKDDPDLGCSGTKGNYLEKSCSQEKPSTCILTQNKNVIEQVKVLQFKGKDLILDSEVRLNNPYILNIEGEKPISIKFSLNWFVNTDNYKVKNINVKKLEVQDKSKSKLSEIIFNKKLINFDDSISGSFNLADTQYFNSKLSLVFILTLEYVVDIYNKEGDLVKSENKRVSLYSGLDKWPVINANLDP